jgi:hypothetical protein
VLFHAALGKTNPADADSGWKVVTVLLLFQTLQIPTQETNLIFAPMSSDEPYQHGKPSAGMMCLCTMEDITEEDQNYGKR